MSDDKQEDVEPVPEADPADEAAAESEKPGAGADSSVPGAATAGAGGAKRARDED